MRIDLGRWLAVLIRARNVLDVVPVGKTAAAGNTQVGHFDLHGFFEPAENSLPIAPIGSYPDVLQGVPTMVPMSRELPRRQKLAAFRSRSCQRRSRAVIMVGRIRQGICKVVDLGC
jgi:hypothetical protein